MKRRFTKNTAVALIFTLVAGMTVNGNIGVAAESVELQNRVNIIYTDNKRTEQLFKTEIEKFSSEDLNIEDTTEEITNGGTDIEKTTTEESTAEETTNEETTTEETTTEEITTEESTTEEPTTLDYEIIDDVYKVKNGVLIEYLGDKDDSEITELLIPREIKKINNNIFENSKYITKVTFEPGSVLTEIGDYAFESCVKMTSITLPKGLKKIGKKAFAQCTSLTKLTIPSTVTSGEEILGKSKSVKKVTFASGIKEIPNDILKYAYSVESISIKSGVKAIGNRAFYKCKGLKSVTIPSTVTSIRSSAFNRCTSLAKVSMSKNITSIGTYAFKKCTSLKELTLRKTIKAIGRDVFAGSTNLTLLVYANSTGKAYARKNKIRWQYTSSEQKRRAASQNVYKKYQSLINAKDAGKYKLKYLKNYVPQGLCIVGDYVIVSMYYRGMKKNSILLLYNKNTGKYVKKVELPSKDHVGSITNVKGRLVVGLTNISITDYVAVISYSKLKKIKSGKKIKYDYMVKIPGYADFASYDGTIFWAGHSANISNAKMFGYKVKLKKKKLVFTKKYSYTVPANSQGLIVKKGKGSKRTFVFSQSYGRLGDSSLHTYSIKIGSAKSLGKVKSTKLIPSMSEGIYLTKKGMMYIVFESGAGLYCADPDLTTEIRVNNVGRMKYSDIAKLQSK